MTILVVDDNTMLLSKLVRSLSLAKLKVRSASSIEQAKEMLEQFTPKILCLDLQLPDGNGLDLLAELRSKGYTMPVLIISGNQSVENLARARELGASGFLAKPFALAHLRALLEKLLESSLAQEHPTEEGQTSLSTTPYQSAPEPLPADRLQHAKWGYTTRHVKREVAVRLIMEDYHPQAGDLVLAKVDKLNQLTRLELGSGRNATLFMGDEIVVCYGNCHAPNQFESEVPKDLSSCDLVDSGGIASLCLSRDVRMMPATRITPIGILADAEGLPINLSRFGFSHQPAPKQRPGITAVIGTSMSSGKTTTLSGLAHGLSRQGLRVGTAKVTGTGSGCEVWLMTDAGAQMAYDFTDCGVPSTYKLSLSYCTGILETLIAKLCEAQVDTILLEVADGILQQETRDLLCSPLFSELVDQVMLAAGDPLGAASGVDWLRLHGLKVIGVSGAMTCGPLSMRESANLIDVPIVDQETLRKGEWQLNAILNRTAGQAEQRNVGNQAA